MPRDDAVFRTVGTAVVCIKGEVKHSDLGLTRYDDRSFEPGFYFDTPFTQLRLGLNVSF